MTFWNFGKFFFQKFFFSSHAIFKCPYRVIAWVYGDNLTSILKRIHTASKYFIRKHYSIKNAISISNRKRCLPLLRCRVQRSKKKVTNYEYFFLSYKNVYYHLHIIIVLGDPGPNSLYSILQSILSKNTHILIIIANFHIMASL